MGAALIYKGKDIRSFISMTGLGWVNLHPSMQEKVTAIIADANKHFKPLGLSVGMFEGWRTPERQQEHIDNGASFIDSWLESYHVWGLGADFVFLNQFSQWTWEPAGNQDTIDSNKAWYDHVLEFVGFSDDPNRELWNQLGQIIEAHGLEWGGRWRRFDGPHGQLTSLGNISSLTGNYEFPHFTEWVNA